MIWIVYLFCPPIAVLFRRGFMPAVWTALSYFLLIAGAYIVGYQYMTSDPKSAAQGINITINNSSGG